MRKYCLDNESGPSFSRMLLYTYLDAIQFITNRDKKEYLPPSGVMWDVLGGEVKKRIPSTLLIPSKLVLI